MSGMQLEDIVKSWENLTQDERMDKLRGMREDRKISKHAQTVSKARSKTKKKKTDKLVNEMSDDEKQALFKLLTEGS